MAHWAIHPALEALGAYGCTGCDNERFAQAACRKPRAMRLRITNTNPIPVSIRLLLRRVCHEPPTPRGPVVQCRAASSWMVPGRE